MKAKVYIRDRTVPWLIRCGAWALSLVFLFAFRVPAEAAVIVSVLLLLGAVGAEVLIWLRKKRFYDGLLSNLDRLDQKYLLPEMIGEPDFAEGRVVCEILRETDKSMCERIAAYRRENADFREYIELWVHEIKLPVAALGLMCHNDGAAKYAAQLRRVDDCVENVLYYTRSGSAEKDYLIKPVSLSRAFADIAVRSREELLRRGISIRTENLGLSVMTDGKWLGFILGQLMSNSVKYGAKEIAVTAEDFPDRTVLRFRDDGAGISESDLPYIFEKSFTGENGRVWGRSTGMGLYLVKKLCGKLGHGVTANSEKGKYTEIVLTFGKNEMYRMPQPSGQTADGQAVSLTNP